jgi:hypothetical protein
MSASDLSIFENYIVGKDGLKYYVIPVNYPLFKATTNIHKGETMQLRANQHSFFGLKNMSPLYIDEYQDEYGVIFEYKTTRVYNLIALNDSATVDLLYQSAPNNIKQILDNNYGHISGKRDSESNNDRTLSMYLCSLNYDGYAIHNMMNETGGRFHTELMICNCDGIEYVGQITEESRVEGILESAKVKEMSKRMEESRKQAKEEARKMKREKEEQEQHGKMRLFGDFDDDEHEDDKPKSLFRFDDDTPFRNDMIMKTPIRPLNMSNAFQRSPKTSTKKRLFDINDEDEDSEERTPEKMLGRGRKSNRIHKSKSKSKTNKRKHTKKHKKHNKRKHNYTCKQKRKQKM